MLSSPLLNQDTFIKKGIKALNISVQGCTYLSKVGIYIMNTCWTLDEPVAFLFNLNLLWHVVAVYCWNFIISNKRFMFNSSNCFFKPWTFLRFLFLQFTHLYNRNTKCRSCVTFMLLFKYMQSLKPSLSLMYTEDVSQELMCSTHLSQCHF